MSASPLPAQASAAMTHLTVRSDWGSGYCADVQVSNPHPFSLVWQVSLPIHDTIHTLWDAVYTQQGHEAVISGATWNKLLAPGQATVFGFCARRQQ